MAKKRNRVKALAEQRGWDAREIYDQAVRKGIDLTMGTIYRFYGNPDYLGKSESLFALAQIFGLSSDEMVETIEAPEKSNSEK